MIERVARGEVTPDEAEAFAQHLEWCESCAARLEALDVHHDLVLSLQNAAASVWADDASLEARIGKLQGLPMQLEQADQSTASQADDSSLPGSCQPRPAEQIQVPGFEILSVLGRGGMGVVYHARHIQLGRFVALKMILAGAHASPEQHARFSNEARAVARLQHVNIVQIYEVGEHDGRAYFSLEYLDGGSLAQKLSAGPLRPHDAAVLAEKLARAVHFAHQHGVVHRDLKPANVLLSSDGTPKITDFGLAKQIDVPGLTESGMLMAR